MRLPQMTTTVVSGQKTPGQLSDPKNHKRAVLSGLSCNPYVVKTTPFEFDTADGYGLAFGDQTFHKTDGVRIDPSNLPPMHAVRKQIEPGSGVASPELCAPADFTFAAEQLEPQFVIAPNETLRQYVGPADVRQGPLVWKMTPFFVETNAGGFVANGTDNVSAAGSNLSLNLFPMQLALRPSIEFVGDDARPNYETQRFVTAAPTNVYTIRPIQPSSDAKIIAYLTSVVPAPTATLSPSPLTGAPSASATIASTTPSAALANFAAADHGAPYDPSIGRYIVGGTAGILVLMYVGQGLYNKARNGGFFRSKPAFAPSQDAPTNWWE